MNETKLPHPFALAPICSAALAFQIIGGILTGLAAFGLAVIALDSMIDRALPAGLFSLALQNGIGGLLLLALGVCISRLDTICRSLKARDQNLPSK